VILRFKKLSSVAIFAANKTFAYFTVKKMGLNNQSFTGTIGIHYRGRCHIHIPYGIASRAEFPFHTDSTIGYTGCHKYVPIARFANRRELMCKSLKLLPT
jgi:hypothetical protein